jgi:dTDP-4-dehydrorhamnose reductase
MKILLIGSLGQLGVDLAAAFSADELLSPRHEDLDVTDEEKVRLYFEEHKPDVAFNTAAFHDVPVCEREPERAFAVNSAGPRNLARACNKVGARFFHISTDYVFDGTLGRPYEETDSPAPLMIYGASKLAGEHLALAENPDTVIFRTCGLFGQNPCRAKPNGRNFVELMLHLGRERGAVEVVLDQLCCPTYTTDLAAQLAITVTAGIAPGIYHAVSPFGCSWFEYAKMIFEIAGMDVKVTPVTSDRFYAAFRRPADSRLACTALKRTGLYRMRPLSESIAAYLSENRNED